MVRQRSPSQIAAEKRYEHKRKLQPRLPAARLTKQEHEMAEAVFERFGGSKKSAILEGLRLLARSLNNKSQQDCSLGR